MASRSEPDIGADKSHALTDAILISRLARAHNFDTGPAIAPAFWTLPGASSVVNGAAQAHDSAPVTGSSERRWRMAFHWPLPLRASFPAPPKVTLVRVLRVITGNGEAPPTGMAQECQVT
jgi:hypothetical protein